MAFLGKARHYHVLIQRRHFNSTANKVGYGESADTLLEELITQSPDMVALCKQKLSPDFHNALLTRFWVGCWSQSGRSVNAEAESIRGTRELTYYRDAASCCITPESPNRRRPLLA